MLLIDERKENYNDNNRREDIQKATTRLWNICVVEV
jgi:hypothetical protein